MSDLTLKEVSDKIESNRDIIQKFKEKLLLLAATSPRDVRKSSSDDWAVFDSWEDYVQEEVNHAVDTIGVYMIENHLLELTQKDLENVVEDC